MVSLVVGLSSALSYFLGLLFLFNPKDLFYIFSSVVSLFLINIKWYGNFMSSYRADVITDFLKERPVPITRFYLEKTSVAESEPVVPFFRSWSCI